MYKDKAKQREANRRASQRRRDKGMTQGMTNEGMMPQGMTHNDAAYNYSRNPVALVKSKRGKQGVTLQTPSGLTPEPPVYTEQCILKQRE